MSHIRLQVLESRTPWEIKWEEAKRLTKYSSFCQKKGDFQEAFLALDQAVTLNHSGIIMNIRKRKNKNLSDSTMLKMRKNLVLLSQRNNLQEMLESSQVKFTTFCLWNQLSYSISFFNRHQISIKRMKTSKVSLRVQDIDGEW